MGKQTRLHPLRGVLKKRLNRKIGAFAVVQCLVILDAKLLKM